MGHDTRLQVPDGARPLTELALSPPLSIELDPLDRADRTGCLRDPFAGAPDETERFAEIVLRKTDGNPLSVRRFVRYLHQARLFWFDTISRHLVEAHGGSVSVGNRRGQGATFVVTLPCRPPEGSAKTPTSWSLAPRRTAS